MARKLAKTVRIFVEIEHMKNQWVTFWPKRIGRLFPTLWSGHESGHEFGDHSIAWEISIQFFWAKCDPPVFVVFYLQKYSHSFSQFPWLIIQFFRKTSVMTMAILLSTTKVNLLSRY